MKKLLQTLFFCLLLTQICFAQWVQLGLADKSIKDIAVQNSNIFAVTSDNGFLYRSIDDGATWTKIVEKSVVDVAISPTGKVFMIRSGLSSSLDNGATWTSINIMEQISDSTYGNPVNICASPSGQLFCHIKITGPLLYLDKFAVSTDDGQSWDTPNILGGYLFDFRNQFVITEGCGAVQLSSDYGNTWSLLGYIYNYGYAWDPSGLGLFLNGNILITGINVEEPILLRHTFISTDMCSTWTQQATLNDQVGLSFHTSSSEGMLIGTEDLGVFLFSDEGDSLGSRNEGLANLNIQTLTLDNNGYVYAGTENGVWRRPLTEIVTSVENESIQLTELILEQNYPNPFNPNTIIKYSIPQSSQVILKLFNTLGEEIETLVNEEKSVGTYELNWNAVNLPSGVYFYRLQAGSFVETKKMILLK